MSDIPDYMYQLIASTGISQNMPGLVITSGPSSGSLFNGTSGFTGFTFSGNTGDFSGITVDIVSGFEGSYGSGVQAFTYSGNTADLSGITVDITSGFQGSFGSGIQAFTYSGNTADLSGATIDIISGFLGAYGSGVTGFTMSGNTADLSGATIDIMSGMQGGFASGVIAPTFSGTQFTGSGVISPIISGSRAVLNSGLEVPTISGNLANLSGLVIGTDARDTASLMHVVGKSGGNMRIRVENSGPSNADVFYINSKAQYFGGVIGAGEWRLYENTIGAERLKVNISGSVIQYAPNFATANADMNNNNISFYLNEAGNTLTIKAKYSDGTVKTGTVALA